MPLVEASRTRLDPSKIFRAFFDAIYVKGLPNTQPASSLCGKHSRDITRAWNGAGEEPPYSLMSFPRRTGTGPSHSPSDRRSKTGSCGCPICSARGYGCCCSALGRRPTPQTSLPRHSALPGNFAGGPRWRHAAARHQLPPRPTRTEHGTLGVWICDYVTRPQPGLLATLLRRPAPPPPSRTRAAEQPACFLRSEGLSVFCAGQDC